MKARIDVLLDFIGAGGTVCPFAAGSQFHVVDLSGGMGELGGIASVRAFGRSERNAMIVPATDAAEAMFPRGPWGLTLSWAREAFLDLADLLIAFQRPEMTGAERFREIALVRSILCDDASPIRPQLSIAGRVLMTICMAPIYPRTHPRYAPATCLVVTWAHEVEAAAKSVAGAAIRAVMAREHGSIYDANELLLPLPGTS